VAAAAGRVFGPGDLRLVLLALIEAKPRHGYELIKELEHKFGGGYAPSPGSVYPTLTLLEELGQVRAAATEGRSGCSRFTEEGKQYLRENQAAHDSAMARMEWRRARPRAKRLIGIASCHAHPQSVAAVPSGRLGRQGDRARPERSLKVRPRRSRAEAIMNDGTSRCSRSGTRSSGAG